MLSELSPTAFYCMCLLLGSCVGSFLNLIIYRLPKILVNHGSQTNTQKHPSINLCFPRSFCPNCKQTLPWYRNIPILSYCLQKGRCHHCFRKISWQYPCVELLSASLTLYASHHFGLCFKLYFVLIFLWLLLTLSAIDIKTFLLPDQLNLGLLWVGLFANTFDLFTSLYAAVLGVIIAYCGLRLFTQSYAYCCKKEGMGQGDVKLFSAIGAWLGYDPLLLVLIFAALIGLTAGLLLFKKRAFSEAIPFGPCLACSGAIFLFYGEAILANYPTFSAQFF